MQDNFHIPTLGIDYGDSKIGLALSYGVFAEPLCVVRYGKLEQALGSISEIVEREGVGLVVIGVSESESEEKAITFGEEISKTTGLRVVFQDETLSTSDAQRMAREAGKGRKKLKEMEDAYAAAIILQSYLDIVTRK